MGVQTLKDNYNVIALLIQWEHKPKEQSTDKHQNIEHDFKIL